jgi:hypothetical protein
MAPINEGGCLCGEHHIGLEEDWLDEERRAGDLLAEAAMADRDALRLSRRPVADGTQSRERLLRLAASSIRTLARGRPGPGAPQG